MTRLIILLFLSLLSLGFAQESTPLTLNEAVGLAAEASADVRTARSVLSSAERDLARVEADPLSLRLDRLQARQDVASAETSLRNTLVRNQLDTASAYIAVMEEEADLTLAHMQLELAETTLEAQLVRLEAGAITQLDADRARNDYDAAVRRVIEAETDRDLAFTQLSSLLGVPMTELAELELEPMTLPSLEEVVVAALEQHTQILSAERAVELAQARLETVDNAFSTRVDIQNARDNLASAETNLLEAKRSLELSVRGTYNSVVAAVTRVESAEASYRTSLAELEAQRSRFEAGSISLLALRQAEIGHLNAEASLVNARHALHLAVLRLEQAITG